MSTYDSFADKFSQSRKSFYWFSINEFKKYTKSGDKILDVGCGGGRVFSQLKELGIDFDYVGIDNSQGMITEAIKANPGGKFHIMDMTSLCFSDESFDQIWVIASFHHLQSRSERVKALSEFKRVLKPGGLVCMTNWNFSQKKFWSPWFQIKRLFDKVIVPWKNNKQEVLGNRYYHGFYLHELRKLFKQSGFEIVDEFYEGKDSKVGWSNGKNICHVLRKK